jgi:hypothetical protein
LVTNKVVGLKYGNHEEQKGPLSPKTNGSSPKNLLIINIKNKLKKTFKHKYIFHNALSKSNKFTHANIYDVRN